MIRSERLKEFAPIIRDQPVVCDFGLPNPNIRMSNHQPTNVYIRGTMDPFSCFGFGLARPQPKSTFAMKPVGIKNRFLQTVAA